MNQPSRGKKTYGKYLSIPYPFTNLAVIRPRVYTRVSPTKCTTHHLKERKCQPCLILSLPDPGSAPGPAVDLN